MTLTDTFGSPQWVADNIPKILALLPETWTHFENMSMMKIGFGLKLLGVDWRSHDDLSDCMVFFERTGLMKRDGLLFRRANWSTEQPTSKAA